MMAHVHFTLALSSFPLLSGWYSHTAAGVGKKKKKKRSCLAFSDSNILMTL